MIDQKNKIVVAKTSEIKDGGMKTVSINGKNITIARVDKDYFAFDDICTHNKCSLGEGYLDGTVVICPCHGATFDVTNGKVLSLPANDALSTYDVLVEESDILLKF